MSQRKQRDGRFKAQVALEAIKNQQSIRQIASEYGVNPSSEQIAQATGKGAR
jgi:transposase-like protein